MRNLFLLYFVVLSFAAQAQNQSHCGHHIMTQKLLEQNPEYQADLDRLDANRPALSAIQANERAVLTIPIVVHVIHPTGLPIGVASNLNMNRIQSQIDVLNEDYRRLNADASNTPTAFLGVAADAEIEFCLATVDPQGNATTGVLRHEYPNPSTTDYIEDVIKPATRWNANEYLNIWTVRIPNTGGGQILGYSYLPTQQMIGSVQDGLVVDDRYFGRYSSVGGRTATHELGHYLGLNHPWGNFETCGSDDGIADTPATDGPNYGCPSSAVSCNSNDMYMNYMDYVDDACMNVYTQGQKNIMQAVLNGTAGGFGFGSRASLVASVSTACSVSAVTQQALNASFITQPNPVSTSLTIDVNLKEQADKMTITVYNILGQIISEKILTNVMTEQVSIDMSAENTGVYFVSLNADGVIATKKIVKK